MPGSHRSTPTIGFLVHDLIGTYQATLLSGVSDFFREQGANLICFPGGEIESTHDFYRKRNILYDFVNAHNMDGLVIASAVLGNYVSVRRLQEFCNRYRPLPMASISVPLEGIPSVLIDNQVGMRESLKHLIEVHGYRQLAFIQGIEGNPDSEERYRIYLETLAQHGIRFDPQLVVRGHFSSLYAVDAINILINERKVTFDAVVAANDEMAFGAMRALQARGLYVPDDVAISGFDDVEEASSTIPPLTTVKQPIYEQARTAAKLVWQQIQQQSTPSLMTLPTRLVVRQSCGCLSQAVQATIVEQVLPAHDALEPSLMAQRQTILWSMSQAVGIPTQGITFSDLEGLLDAFTSEFLSKSGDTFFKYLNRLARQVMVQSGEVARLQKALFVLRRFLLPYVIDKGTAVLELDNLWQQSHALIEEYVQRSQTYKIFQIGQQVRGLSDNTRRMVSSHSIDGLMDVLAHELPFLGIEACYFSLYEKPDESIEWSRLMMAYNHNGRIQLEPEGKRFPTDELIPGDVFNFDQPCQLVVEPVYFEDDQLGFVVFEMNAYESLIYEELSEQLGSIVRSIFSLAEHKKVEEDLRELNQLKNEFISTTAHELRTPLTSIRGFSEILLTRDFDPERHKRYLSLINQQATQLGTLINELLDISRLEAKRNLELALEVVNIEEVVSAVVATLKETSATHQIQVQGLQDCPEFISDPVRLTQVIQNLLSNAIKYSPNGGAILIQGELTPGCLQISVQDHGIGMTPEQQSHLFAKFYRANTSNPDITGTGLGLAISKLIIELLGGKIWAQSEYGVGSTFYITLPLKSEAM